MKNVTRFINITVKKVEKHAPKILFVAGMVGFGATVAASSKAGVDAKPVLDDIREEMHDIATHTNPSTRERQLATLSVGRTHGAKLVKIYAPTIVLGAVTVLCLTKSHNILTSRNVALTAAFGSLEKAYREYRARVVDHLGEEMDTMFAHNAGPKEVLTYDSKGNPVVQNVIRGDKDADSLYSFFFDETNRCWDKDPGYNRTFLDNQQTWWNLELKAKGIVFLNDVLKSIGFEPTPEGQLVGWVYDSKDGDGYVDFGFNRYPDFVAGYERSVRLEFNVDGLVLDKI